MAADDFIYSQEDLLTSSFSFMYDMKEKGMLNDVTIRIGGHSFSAHRIILAAGIPYFRDMLEENRKNEVSVTELDPVAFESLINFAYTNKVKITTKNVRCLLTASQFLQMTKVGEACCDFLSKMLDLENVMDIRNLGDSLKCQKLMEICEGFIRKNFEDFCQTKEFLGLPNSVLNELIRRDDLYASNEEKVFEAVTRWVEADTDERHSFLPELLTGVRMTLLSPEYLIKKASKEKLILESFPCRDLLDEAKHYHLLPKEPPSFSWSFTTVPRSCEEKSVMYAICSEESTELNVQKYNPNTGKWSTLFTDKNRWNVEYVLALGRRIYFFYDSNSIEALDPLTLVWSSCSCKNQRDGIHIWRNTEHVVACNNGIYWFSNNKNTVSVYDPELDRWFTKYTISKLRIDGAFSSEKDIYTFVSNSRRRQISSYDRRTGSLIPVAEWSDCWYRHKFGCAVLKDNIYLCGGESIVDNRRALCQTNIEKDVVVYNLSSKMWDCASPMNTNRADFSLIPYNEKLYAIGGIIGMKKLTSSVECYDPITDKWTIAGSLNGQSYGFIKAVVVPAAKG